MSTPAAGVVVHPLVALCSKLLTEFLTGERGHPGREALRSRWVDVAQLDQWQDQLAALASEACAAAAADGVLAAVAVATEMPGNSDPDELIEALAGVVAERDALRVDLAVARSSVDDVREAVRRLWFPLPVGVNTSG